VRPATLKTSRTFDRYLNACTLPRYRGAGFGIASVRTSENPLTKSNTGTREPQTKASWRVRDIAAEVAELRSRGVEVAGIADVGFALAAWFSDPAGNSLGLLQFKDAERA
jgi:hypothetical protein